MAPDLASRIRARFMRRGHSDAGPAPADALSSQSLSSPPASSSGVSSEGRQQHSSTSLLRRCRGQPSRASPGDALAAPPLSPVLALALDRGLQDASANEPPADGPQRLSADAHPPLQPRQLAASSAPPPSPPPSSSSPLAATSPPPSRPPPPPPQSQPASPPPPPPSHPLLGSPHLRSIHENSLSAAANSSHGRGHDQQLTLVDACPSSSSSSAVPASAPRQAPFASRQSALAAHLPHRGPSAGDACETMARKVWVKRPHASATTIAIHEDDLVDDVRDLILRKYANSLGRTFDSPDLSIRACARGQEKDRVLGPEETMARMLDRYYPGGQTVDEALVVDIPRRTPRPSPMAPPVPGTTAIYLADESRPSEAGEGYFPPVVSLPSPHVAHSVPVATNGAVGHSIAILGTGHVPLIPSPGGGARPRTHRDRSERPRLVRQHTASPTILPAGPVTANVNHATQHFAPRMPHSRTHSSSSDHQGLPTIKTPKPKSPGPVPEPTPAKIATPPPRISSPHSSSARPKKSKKSSEYPAAQTGSMLNGAVPPISVLIVEDNPINLKLLEAFVKRLKVRWQTAMNGRDAVKKWRTGGFHLVLMDIQLPVMNGLDATREIRRLERVNSIGVFSSLPSGMHEDTDVSGELKEQDRLENPSLFKSPVIIVALTASSLQSDRHEALAAGCNDFLTKVSLGRAARPMTEPRFADCRSRSPSTSSGSRER